MYLSHTVLVIFFVCKLPCQLRNEKLMTRKPEDRRTKTESSSFGAS